MRALHNLLTFVFIVILAALSSIAIANHAQAKAPGTGAQSDVPQNTVPTLRPIGSRGFYVLDGPFAEFDPTHPSVDIWVPQGTQKPPVMVYAHGGAGFREDDAARVQLFRENGFATISFDSYSMNGFDNWQFVTRKVANSGKQQMNWGVFKGAVAYAQGDARWDAGKIVLYGGSNGGRVVLYAGSELSAIDGIRAIISEAPAATGYPLGDYDIPTLVPFGALDTWAGRSDTDYVWKRTYPNSPISIEDWVTERQAAGRPVAFRFYADAGHLMFEGPLKLTTVRRGDRVAFTAYEGASPQALYKYKKDVIAFAKSHLAP
ncbi:MAG: hypothetical protein JJ850_06650 [Kordiimonadaceae bacterium]|nr:hypothetical protein [Kordiimonadaceae bacterium]MBO6567993.1 hypothetical protein [Kordiimonadaceae bacterium]MBO6964277.1 hypothetical protein [Kordiimonadaceae bacterium]